MMLQAVHTPPEQLVQCGSMVRHGFGVGTGTGGCKEHTIVISVIKTQGALHLIKRFTRWLHSNFHWLL